MPRSQEFGFHIENLCRIAFGLFPKNNDTKIHDIPAEENPFDKNETLSIKTAGVKGSICCGDAIRFSSYGSDQTHTMILVRYEQLATTRKIVEIIELNMTEDFMKILFGTASLVQIKAIDDYLKAIPSGRCSEEQNKTYKKMAKDLKVLSGGWITYNPKVDSKSQRRLQCSISKFDTFLEKYPQFIKSRVKECIIRGRRLVAEHPFGKRFSEAEDQLDVEAEPESGDSAPQSSPP